MRIVVTTVRTINYDSDEADFPSKQDDDQNIQNPQLNLEHADEQQFVDQANRIHNQIFKTQIFSMVEFQNLALRFSICYQLKMK